MRHEIFLIFSTVFFFLLSLILFFGPRDWFPLFSHPLFLSVLLFLSPALTFLPSLLLPQDSPFEKRTVLRMQSGIAFALLINFGGELGLFQLYRFGFQYDKFAHFLVCMLIAFLSSEYLYHLRRFSLIRTFMWVLSVTLLAGIAWEILEATSDVLFHTQEWGINGTAVFWDTSWDIFFNFLGILSGILVFILPLAFKKTRSLPTPKQISKPVPSLLKENRYF